MSPFTVRPLRRGSPGLWAGPVEIRSRPSGPAEWERGGSPRSLGIGRRQLAGLAQIAYAVSVLSKKSQLAIFTCHESKPLVSVG